MRWRSKWDRLALPLTSKNRYMERIPAFILTLGVQPLREVPGFGTLAHSPGAERVGSIAVVSPSP